MKGIITWWRAHHQPPTLTQCQAGAEDLIAGTYSCPLRWCWLSESNPEPDGCLYWRNREPLDSPAPHVIE